MKKLGRERLPCPRPHKARIWTQLPLNLGQFFTLFNDCVPQKRHEVHQKTYYPQYKELTGQWRRHGFEKGHHVLVYQRHWEPSPWILSPQRQLMWLPRDQRPTSPKDQMILNLKDAQSAVFLKLWSQGGEGRPRRKEKGLCRTQLLPSLKMEGRIVFHTGIITVRHEFHQGFFSNHIFIWLQR